MVHCGRVTMTEPAALSNCQTFKPCLMVSLTSRLYRMWVCGLAMRLKDCKLTSLPFFIVCVWLWYVELCSHNCHSPRVIVISRLMVRLETVRHHCLQTPGLSRSVKWSCSLGYHTNVPCHTHSHISTCRTCTMRGRYVRISQKYTCKTCIVGRTVRLCPICWRHP